MTLSPTERLRQESAAINPLDPALAQKAQAYLDTLTKPQGSLGILEDIAKRLYCIQEHTPLKARPACLFTIAGDHGVVAEGVASVPQAVTVQMIYNFLQNGAAINALCSTAGVDLRIVDTGVANHTFPPHPLFIDKKIAHGTGNLATEPAMSLDDCAKAMEVGITLAEEARKQGYVALGTGEMGIGNTTPSSALFCAYLGFSAEAMTGMGAGVPPAGLAHKTAVIDRALQTHAATIRSQDPFAILAALGGLEIAALAGLIIGGAARRMPVVIDGFIATAAYVAASKIAPAVEEYCFFSHASAESGHALALQAIKKKALLDLGMRLGEGTGAALGLFLLEAAANAYNSMATFESAGVET